jgi:hypothetical protein
MELAVFDYRMHGLRLPFRYFPSSRPLGQHATFSRRQKVMKPLIKHHRRWCRARPDDRGARAEPAA